MLHLVFGAISRCLGWGKVKARVLENLLPSLTNTAPLNNLQFFHHPPILLYLVQPLHLFPFYLGIVAFSLSFSCICLLLLFWATIFRNHRNNCSSSKPVVADREEYIHTYIKKGRVLSERWLVLPCCLLGHGRTWASSRYPYI